MYRFRRQRTEPHVSVFPTKIGFTMFWIRTQLEISGFIPNWNQPRIMNQCFFREVFEEKNSRLKLGQLNAKCTMFCTKPWYSYHGKRSITTAFAIFPALFILRYTIINFDLKKQDNFLTILNMGFLVMTEIWQKIWKDLSATHLVSNNRISRWKLICALLLFVLKYKAAKSRDLIYKFF